MPIEDVAPPEESAPSAPEAPDADTNAAEAPSEETGNVLEVEAPPEQTGTAQPAAEAPSSSTRDQGRPKNGSYGLKPSEPPTRKAPKAGSASFSSTKGSAHHPNQPPLRRSGFYAYDARYTFRILSHQGMAQRTRLGFN